MPSFKLRYHLTLTTVSERSARAVPFMAAAPPYSLPARKPCQAAELPQQMRFSLALNELQPRSMSCR